jgi:hypothetical protein
MDAMQALGQVTLELKNEQVRASALMRILLSLRDGKTKIEDVTFTGLPEEALNGAVPVANE